MSIIFSVVSAASQVAAKMIVVGAATSTAVFVVGALTKPSYESFISSFDAFKKLEKLESVERTTVMDCVIFTVVQSNFKESSTTVQDAEQNTITTTVNNCMMSYGFLNNWIHGTVRRSSTISTSFNLK